MLRALAVAAAAFATAAPTYTLTIDQPSPVHGDTVTFTGTFPQAAFRQAHNPQFHQNPYLYVFCSDAVGNRVLAALSAFPDKDGRNPDGSINAQSWPVLLHGNGGNEGYWPDGVDADCVAASGWWTDDKDGVQFHKVAEYRFHAGAG